MMLKDRFDEEVKKIKRTLQEEIEISELSQLVSVFDDDEENAKKDYKEAKRELIKRVNSIKK